MKTRFSITFSIAALVLLGATLANAATTTNPPSALAVATVPGQCKQLKLTWNDNSTFVPEDFQVERGPSSGGPFALIATAPGGSGTTKTYLDTTVDDKTTYWYQVRWSSNNVRFSTYSNISSNNTGVICTPSGLTVSALISSCVKMNLSWTDNSKVDTEYRIERTAPGGTCASAFTQIAVNPGNGAATGTMTYQDTTVAGGTQYGYRVRAYRLSDNSFSAYSNCATNKTTSCGATK